MPRRTPLARFARRARSLIRATLADDGMVFLGLFVVTVIVNGLVTILIIEWLQSMGLWQVPLGRPGRSEVAAPLA